MPVLNRIAGFADEMQAWRRHLHANPEIGFDCHETAAFVAERLRQFGVDEIVTGIAETGLVAMIHGQQSGPVIGLRADMDALPMQEDTGLDHASKTPGRMHACGHDGHVTMLLGAAKYLAETRAFAGSVALIFQPAEESGGGGDVMCREGVLDRFDISQVYALHTAPDLPLGHFITTPGPMLAAVDTFHIDVTGRGGHGALPHEACDPIAAAVAIVQAIQTIVSRNHRGTEDLVISVTQIHSGTADNIIPDTAHICGTVRTFDSAVQDMVEARLTEIAAGTGAAMGVEAALRFERGYPATINTETETRFSAAVAAGIVGETAVNADAGRDMGAEDFAYFLENRPGAYLFIGQGDGPGLHNARFDFNDEISPIGASFFARLAEQALPLDPG